MGKKVKFTGSKLLGQELRRLRGDRSLAQVAALSRSEPLRRRIHPVSAPGLSQIETGVSFPNVDTLHSLATIYQTPMQQLLDLVVQERLVEDVVLPETHDEAKASFGQAFEAGRWREAMAVAARGEELCEEPSQAVMWRANRAICMQQFGLRDDAVQVLLRCTSDPEAPPARLFQLYRSLAEALASAGHVGPAAAIAARALDLAPEDVSSSWRWQLLSTRARLVLLENEVRQPPDSKAVREAQKNVQQALELVEPEQEQARLILRIHDAIAHRLLGNPLVAARDLESVRSDGRAGEQPLVEVLAAIALGSLRREQEAWADAARVLAEAEQLAVDEDFVDEAFEVYFELHLVSKSRGDGRDEYYLKRCRRYYPLVQAKSPNVIAYERLVRRRA